jgi:hypothetical protein
MIFAVLFSFAIAGQADASAVCDAAPSSEACGEARFERTLARLPVPSIEDEAAAGAVVYRARQFDAWYTPLPVVSFERLPGQSPQVAVRGMGGAQMSAPASAEIWDRVVAEAAFADRDLAPLPRAAPSPSGAAVLEEVCMDGGTAMVEMANVPAGWDDHRAVRRKVSSTCASNLTTTFADLLPELAIASLPPCMALNGPLGGVYRLRECLTLKGDALAAADLLNAVRDIPDEDRSVTAWSRWLQVGVARLDWAGETVTQRGYVAAGSAAPSIPAFLAERAASLKGLDFYRAETGADGPDRGWVNGLIVYEQEGAGPRNQMSANYRQVWRKTNGGWSLASWTVEPFKPVQ